MRLGPSLIIQGTLIGSFLLASFGLIVSADAAPLSTNTNTAYSASLAAPAASMDPVDSSPITAAIGHPPAKLPAKDLAKQQAAKAARGAKPEDQPEASTACAVSPSYPQSILQWCALITKYSQESGLPANLIAAVMLQESGGQPQAYSGSGAVGLLQVMPRNGIAANFMCKNGPCFASRPTIDELENPEFNIQYGSEMLAGLVNKFGGNVREALKSYGPLDMGYAYADKVLSIYENYGH